MPLTSHLKPPWIPIPVGFVIGVLGLFLVGLRLATLAAPTPNTIAVDTVTHHGTTYLTRTETVSRVVKGKVIRLPGDKVVLRVPTIIVHTDNHRILVPAHTVKLPSAQAAVAQPNLPVTVTVYMPTTVYAAPVTVTSTVTSTVVVPPVTTTVTIPLQEVGPTSS